jgi:hypothetical protein
MGTAADLNFFLPISEVIVVEVSSFELPLTMSYVFR